MDTPYNNDPLPGTLDEQYLNTVLSANASEAPRQLQPQPQPQGPSPLPRMSAQESARAKFEARRAARLASEFSREQEQTDPALPAVTAPESALPTGAASEAYETGHAPAALPAAPSFAPAVRAQRAVSRRQREEQDRRDRASALLASLGLSSPDTAQMSRADLAAVLEVLLSADEASLRRLHDRPDIPASLKTIIRRVLADMQSGSLKALHGLWDRLYGRQPLTAPDAGQAQPSGTSPAPSGAGQLLQDTLQGVLPQQPVSREAYIVIRDTLMR